MKVLRNKKGFNDIFIVVVIMSIILGTATIIPFLNDVGTQAAELNTVGITDNIQQSAESVNTLNAFTILFNVFKLSFFDIGDTLGLPIWLDLFFTILAVILIITIARNIWVGGGS